MSPRLKLAAALAACAFAIVVVSAAIIGVLLGGSSSSEHAAAVSALADNTGALLLVALLLFAILGIALNALVASYVARPLKIAEETRLMLSANPRHRIDCPSPRELETLAAAINELAARRESLENDVDARVAEAHQDLAAERNLLATLMADLTESVIVCNAAGTVLLYNERARQLFDGAADATRAPRASDWIGLGRSIFTAIDRVVFAHAVEHLNHRLREGDRFPIVEFVTAARSGRLLRVRMRAIGAAPSPATSALPGYVLVLHDVRAEVDLGAARERMLRSLTEGTRAAVASIRAATEALMHYPGMDAAQQEKFLGVIHDEADKLGTRIATSFTDDAARLAAEWPLAAVLGRDLMHALQRGVEARCGGSVAMDACEAPLWLSVDTFLLVEALSDLAHRLQRSERSRDMTLHLTPSGARVRLELSWIGAALRVEEALDHENAPIAIPGHLEPLTLKEIVARHGAEVWYQRDADDRSCFRILLPMALTEPPATLPERTGSRPVFYDFDLFHQPGQTPEIDQRPLAELAYTVFDTETTGLEPSRGDEIVAIGAVRIVNQRLLAGEAFDQLVNPRRDVSRAAVRVHGLTHEMLESQPNIEAVLPRFHRYCENTVLVAHNAAFDMRFLQLKEQAAGINFSHPVLDTLLLSAVAHPNQADHSLEAIAARLGLNVIGRHTALGDAILAGEIFLKLIPLLREQGIVTFRQAHEAQQRTPYAKLAY